MNAKAQRGMTTVEFAIVGALALALIFYVIEFGRILFTLNVLDEGARRGARVAAVCDVGNTAISEAVRFVSLPGLTASNVVTEYLNDEGTVLGNPQGADYPLISFVRVTIDNYNFPVALPFVATLFSAPAVSVTMPRESLGVPYFGAPPAC